jgi:hypothetical protein
MLHFGVPVLYIIVDLFPEPLIVERYNSTWSINNILNVRPAF